MYAIRHIVGLMGAFAFGFFGVGVLITGNTIIDPFIDGILGGSGLVVGIYCFWMNCLEIRRRERERRTTDSFSFLEDEPELYTTKVDDEGNYWKKLLRDVRKREERHDGE